MIENTTKEDVLEALSSFSCPLDKNIEEFVREKAYNFETHDLSRTFLIYDNDKFCGIFTLAMSKVDVNSNLTRREKKELFGTTYSLGKTIPAHLIGQISKNFTNNLDELITGKEILDNAKNYIYVANDLTPAPIIRVDCAKKEELAEFYKRCGFLETGILNDNKNDLDMYLIPVDNTNPIK